VIASLAAVIFALPEKDFGGSRKVRNSALLWAVATGACVAIYNVIDAQGVRSGPSQWSFIVWLFLLDWIGINTIAFITRGRRQFMTSARAALWPGLGAGVCSLASFSMALYGFSIAPVAYISAMRETAVVFAALMGWWFLTRGLRRAPHLRGDPSRWRPWPAAVRLVAAAQPGRRPAGACCCAQAGRSVAMAGAASRPPLLSRLNMLVGLFVGPCRRVGQRKAAQPMLRAPRMRRSVLHSIHRRPAPSAMPRTRRERSRRQRSLSLRQCAFQTCCLRLR
jgi:hypothetical protein